MSLPTPAQDTHSGHSHPSTRPPHQHQRLTFLNKIPLNVKNHIIALSSELAGTFLFLLFAFGGTNAVNTAPLQGQPSDLAANPAKLLFISLCFGMSLAVNAWVFYRISGGLFNPAVSVGMMIVGAMDVTRGVMVILSQLLGGIAAAAVVEGLLPGPLRVHTELGGGIGVVQALCLEMLLTAQLAFTIFVLAAEKHRGTFIAPIGIGLSLFIAELMGVYYTGGSLNPARSFGPAVVTGSFPPYHWIYWLGPVLGSLLASGFYTLIKAMKYETVNPGQDHIGDAHLGDAVMDRSKVAMHPIINHPQGEKAPEASGLAVGSGVSGGRHGAEYENGPALEVGEGSKAG
ncbi:aquaporin [Xylariales sp. AK1849]|nr:aquaporin [Xylariales sp. AK1849]